jgi:Bacterial Ig-like domain
MKAAFLFALISGCLLAGQTTVLYNPATPTVGPFPTNALSVADAGQKTGMRINLPSSFETCDVATSPSVCSNTALLNQLDGFSVNSRIMACFSAPIDTTTLKSGIQLIPVGSGQAVSINQIIFDPVSNCAFAKPNQVLNQQSRYLLVITDSVHDATGKKVKEDSAFKNCLKSSDSYCEALASALQQVPQQPGSANKVIAASLFTTMSATSWLEQARRYVDATQLPVVLPAGAPTSFNLSNVQSITWVPQGSGDDTDNSETISPNVLSGVGTIAFGLYLSPSFLDRSSGAIDVTPTARSISAPTGYVPVSFHLFLPSGRKPSSGYPVAIYGHGLGDNQFGAPTYIASTLAQQGIATLAFEITGHGYGSGGVVKVVDNKGTHTAVECSFRRVRRSARPTAAFCQALLVCAIVGARARWIFSRSCGPFAQQPAWAMVSIHHGCSTWGSPLAAPTARCFMLSSRMKRLRCSTGMAAHLSMWPASRSRAVRSEWNIWRRSIPAC